MSNTTIATTLEEGLGRSGTELIVREICSLRGKIDDATTIASDNPFTKGSGANSAVLVGSGSTASGNHSVAEGYGTQASGYASHAGGNNTIVKAQSQTAIGEYNIQDDNNEFYLIVGNGTSTSARNNAFTVSKSGEVMAADGLRVKEDSSSDEVVMRYDSANKCLKFVFE